MMTNTWIDSHNYLLNMTVGDFYLSGGNKIEVVNRTKKRIKFSNGNLVHIKNDGKCYYLDSKCVNKKSMGIHIQILRDIEGYLIYQKLINH